jgi:arylsulfatase A-like enzyme
MIAAGTRLEAGSAVRRRFLTGLAALACLVAAALPAAAAAAEPERPSIVLVLTDDQRYDTLDVMPTVMRELVGRGVTFENAFAVNPTCCPSRATILTGGYSHSTGIWANGGPHAGSDWFDHASTIAPLLQEQGYRTAFLGKYLNHYGGWAPPFLDRWFRPPGWDTWLGNGGGYVGYPIQIAGLMTRHEGQERYSTDVLTSAAVSFLEEDEETPFFLVVAPYAPHHPAVPAERHAGAFADAEPYRPPAYDEPDIADKPRWVRAQPRISESRAERLDALRRRQLETLLAVDEGVARILGTLRASGRLSNTLLAFASDNGLHWGEHRLVNRKSSAYEESIRIPLVVRWDAVVPGPRRDGRLVGNLDLAPTFADVAGAERDGMDGASLVPLLRAGPGNEPRWRTRILVESIPGEGDAAAEIPAYCAVRDARWKYVVYATRDEELYDLETDPGELENLAFRPEQRARVAALRADLVRLCRPAPPGLDLKWLRAGD